MTNYMTNPEALQNQKACAVAAIGQHKDDTGPTALM